MTKALLIAAILAASGGVIGVYAQEQPSGTSQPSSTPPPQEAKKPNAAAVETKREELGQKLLKRKMELDNDRLMQPVQARARERKHETQADDHKGQKK